MAEAAKRKARYRPPKAKEARRAAGQFPAELPTQKPWTSTSPGGATGAAGRRWRSAARMEPCHRQQDRIRHPPTAAGVILRTD